MNIVLATLNAKYIHTNLALRYLKAYAQPEFDFSIAEYTIKDQTMQIVTDLYQRQPQVVMFSCYIWNVEQTLHIITLLKKTMPELVTVVGGPEVSYDMEELLTAVPALDIIVTGEGELAVKNLAAALRDGIPLNSVRGIAFRHDGTIQQTPPEKPLDLKDFPSPYRFPEDLPDLKKRIAYFETSRGCPFNCQFCLSSLIKGVRFFEMEWVKEELRYLMDNGARVIKFLDRTFNTHKAYALEILQFLIDEHRPGNVFQFEITADILPIEIVDFLNASAPKGLFRFEIGVQSTNELTNVIIDRRQDFEKLSRVVRAIKDGGKIDQHLDLIAGLPEEDYDSFRKTFNDVFELRPEELQLGFLKMLRGTGIRRRADDHGYVYMDHPPYEILKNNALSFEEVIQLKQVEDVLEKYWNAHRLDRTMEYLIATAYETPFDLFQAFGSYWETKGWSRIGHQLEDLFKRLLEFLQDSGYGHLDQALAFMKVDYLASQNRKPKIWWETGDKKSLSPLYQKLVEDPAWLGAEFAQLGLTRKELVKNTIIETLPFDFRHNSGLGKHLLVAYFDGLGRNALFTRKMPE